MGHHLDSRLLPDEIWHDVFSYLDWAGIARVNLASARFHATAHPLLFRVFEFHPYCEADYRWHPHGVQVPSVERTLRALRRLEFWTSEAIAPLVRECRVASAKEHTWEWGAWRSPSNDDEGEGGRDNLLHAVVDALPRFPHLHTLHFDGVHFTRRALAGLNSDVLPSLSALVVDGCQIAAVGALGLLDPDWEALVPPRIASLTLGRNHHRDLACIRRPFVDAGALRTLTLLRYDLDTLVAAPTFPRVTTLTIALMQEHWSRVLGKFPATQRLTVCDVRWDEGFAREQMHAPIHEVLAGQALAEFTGPAALLWVLLPLPLLRRVAVPLWESTGPSAIYDEVQAAIDASGELGLGGRVEALKTTFADFDDRNLDALCLLFPNLREMEVGVEVGTLGPCFEVEYFFRVMAQTEDPAPLPPRLERLAMSWRYVGDDNGGLEFGVPKTEYLDGLAARFGAEGSHIRWARLEGPEFRYVWTKSGAGSIEYYNAEEDAEATGAQIEIADETGENCCG